MQLSFITLIHTPLFKCVFLFLLYVLPGKKNNNTNTALQRNNLQTFQKHDYLINSHFKHAKS